jgi:hypothetical protein
VLPMIRLAALNGGHGKATSSITLIVAVNLDRQRVMKCSMNTFSRHLKHHCVSLVTSECVNDPDSVVRMSC